MNVEDIVKKVKELVGEGNIEKATQYIEDHKDELGDQYDKVKDLISKADVGGMLDKVKNFFK